MLHRLSATFLPLLGLAFHAHAAVNYANDFIDPALVLSGKLNYTTVYAQKTIVGWAKQLASDGPWSVTDKPFAPPSGDKHDYLSWAPYWWPDCSKVGNTTALPQEEVWTKCEYSQRDGEFNPDARLVNNIGAFDDMANAVLYNALAWALTRTAVNAERAATFVNVWFLAPDTRMNPNLNYAQMQRGPEGQTGSHTGVLDLKAMAKVVSGVLILRESEAPEWTADRDKALVDWAKEYIGWLTSAKIALQEGESKNNHGTFYYNQLAALQVLVGDKDGAKATVDRYFNTQFKDQIAANGDQPLESARTRPYHYRAYNLAAMITNAKIGAYAGLPDVWTRAASSGATFKTALDYALAQPAGKETAAELYPCVNALGAQLSDADGKYAGFLRANAGRDYVSDAQFLWNQPFSDSGFVSANQAATESAQLASDAADATSTSKTPAGPKHTKAPKDDDSAAQALGAGYGWVLAAAAVCGALVIA